MTPDDYDELLSERVFRARMRVRSGRHRVALGGPDGLRPTGARVALDLPDQVADPWHHQLTLPAGRPCLLATGPAGMQINGENYLLPVSAKIGKVEDVRAQTFSLSEVMSAFEAAAPWGNRQPPAVHPGADPASGLLQRFLRGWPALWDRSA